MILWYFDGYVYYAACILIISVSSAVTSLIETYTNLKKIREMAYYSCPVNVLRSEDSSVLTKTESTQLVPGDVIEIP